MYCSEKELTLNETKCKHLRISLRKTLNIPGYKIKDVSIESVTSHKHLGVIYDNQMFFNDHYFETINKAIHKFNYLKILCKKVDAFTFLRLYKTYILPLIEYSYNCWTPTKTQINLIEKIQKKVTKYIIRKLGKSDLTYDKRLEYLGLQSLEIRRKISALKMLYKVRHSPQKMPINRTQNFNFYQTSRNGLFIRTQFRRIDRIDKNFFNYCIKIFNNLPLFKRNQIDFKGFLNDLQNYV